MSSYFANMEAMFERYSNLGDLAFSHCISADLESDRNMSIGVAVKLFGRPCSGDYYNKHFIFQKATKGASVYCLVRKPQYFNKPKKKSMFYLFSN